MCQLPDTAVLFLPSDTKLWNALCVEGSETKSQQINWKSSSTWSVPPRDVTEPIPREEIPSVIPSLISACKIRPDGVFNISIVDIKSFPLHSNLTMLCEEFLSSTTLDSGWSNSPNARLSSISFWYSATIRSNNARE